MTETSYAAPGSIAPGITQRCEFLRLSPELCKEYAEAVATILQFELGSAGDDTMTSSPVLIDRGVGRFGPATDFIEENLDREIALCELASLVALSVSHFAHAFKAEYGVSPYHYIIVRRIERAKTLLRTTDDTIASIAQRVGFTSNAHFSKSFSKLVGITPSAYRHAGAPLPPDLAVIGDRDEKPRTRRAAVHRPYAIRRGGVSVSPAGSVVTRSESVAG